MIQIFSNTLGQEELQAVQKVFESRWLGKAGECDQFEKELAAHFGTSQVLLTNCCTSAIYISLKAHGIGQGDEVIISSANFVGVANAVVDCGAKPVFADVDPSYFNILPEEIERLKTPKTKAVYLLHYGGHPVRFDEIKKVCGSKIRILEDSANAVSSKYQGVHCGALGDAGVFSFDAMKTLVMGDGGALIVRDPEAFRRAASLRYFGLSQTKTSGFDSMKHGNQRWWEFELELTSGRFISNDILASIGRVQLKKLPGFIAKRKAVWDIYQKAFQNISGLIQPPEPLPGTSSSYYFYWIKTPGRRDELANYLRERGIYVSFRYYPLHLVKYYGSTARLPNAEEMSEVTINLPLHQNLSDEDVSKIVFTVKEFFKR
jgi:aminotransferase